MKQVFVECRELVAGTSCSARFTGSPAEVVEQAATHVADIHGYANNRRLRDRVREKLAADRGVSSDGSR